MMHECGLKKVLTERKCQEYRQPHSTKLTWNINYEKSTIINPLTSGDEKVFGCASFSQPGT